MEKNRKLFYAVGVFLLAIIILAGFSVSAAAETIKVRKDVKGSDFTDIPYLQRKYDELFDGKVMFTDGTQAPIGSSVVKPGKKYFVSSIVNNKEQKFEGESCYIYASAAYKALWDQTNGITYGGSLNGGDHKCRANQELAYENRGDKEKIYKISYELLKSWNVRPGAVVRTSKPDYSGGHSFIILSYDKNSISILHGNADNKGLVCVDKSLNWEEINSKGINYHFIGRENKNTNPTQPPRFLFYIIQPTDEFFQKRCDSNPPEVNVAVPKKEKDAKGFKVVVSAKDKETGVASISVSVQDKSGVFTKTEMFAVSGKSAKIPHRFELRDLGNKPGRYNISVTVYDEAGNPASDKGQADISEPKGSSFTVKYHQDESTGKASSTTTKVTFNKKKQTEKIENLADIKKSGYAFKGWYVHRDYDDTWYMKNKKTGAKYWLPIEKEGGDYIRGVYKSGVEVSRTAPSGTVSFYGVWEPIQIKVQYDSGSVCSAPLQTAVYGGGTTAMTPGQLGSNFSKTGYTLKKWKVSKDGLWLTRNTDTGKLNWRKSVGGDYKYYTVSPGKTFNTVIKAAESGKTLTFVAAWSANKFKINYYANSAGNKIAGSDKVAEQTCTYGKGNKTKTYSQLGVKVPSKGYRGFDGWYVVRVNDKKVRVTNTATGKMAWVSLQDGKIPSGYKLRLYANGCKVTTTVTEGEINFYAHFEPNQYRIRYKDGSNYVGDPQVCKYGKKYKSTTVSSLGISHKGYTFAGWKLKRSDGTYRLKDSSGNKTWKALNNGKLPSGYSYAYYKDGFTITSLSNKDKDTVIAIASWKPIKFKITYGKINGNGPDTADKTTTVTFNTSKQTRSMKSLGFTAPGNNMQDRWRVYRPATGQYLAIDYSNPNKPKRVWITKAEHDNNLDHYVYLYYNNNCSVSRTVATNETVQFLAYWRTAEKWDKFDAQFKAYKAALV